MNYQFYPTGAHTAAAMWAKFKRPIGVVCDPSAGQGHLWRHAQDGFEGLDEKDIPWLSEVPDEEIEGRYRFRLRERARYKFQRTQSRESGNFLAVEINPEHHAQRRFKMVPSMFCMHGTRCTTRRSWPSSTR